ncbi:MAG: bifunctional ADP-dependent NAD(P)H-hydrate dehydratase/NAD(P)H-hydrate epimerase [Nocardioidaceae bacterium]|nr:bifunctional ADP-dependent NAD(P)H-hydrate dehydratase/NAD(P)H-hydrate epimerase [Nocardioidaceae bacterium]
MRQAHTVAQVRAAEAALMATVPDGTLMQRAAAGLAAATTDLIGATYGARVRLLVGSGDNGGDALFAGAMLARRGAQVEAVLLSPDQAHAAGVAALLGAGGRVRRDDDPPETPDVVIDGIVGIGASGGLRPEAMAALRACGDAPVVAVDVPSGVGVDTAEIAGDHVAATLTVTFGTHKVAHLVDPAAVASGAVHLVDIGLDAVLPDQGEPAVVSLQEHDVAALLPRPDPSGHKYSRGVVGLRTGSARYPGAAVLSVSGASCGLVGMVRYDGSAAAAVHAAHPEVVGPGQVQTWVTGCGGGDDAGESLAACLDSGAPVVVDADALRHVTGPLPVQAILTPHAGELAAMLGVDRTAVEAASLAHVRAAADRFEAVVLLKGRRTLVAGPGGPVVANPTGVPWLATAGAGDVLAGLVGSLLAAGLEPRWAAAVGAWLHGAAATLAAAGGPLVASDVARLVPATIATVLAGEV